MSLLEARGATRRFGQLTAVEAVDLTVEPREVVGLLGANGAGKTTLIRMALGLLPPTAGSVRLFGAPPSRRTRSRLGYVPQSLGLYDDLTVAENLSFSTRAFGRRLRPETLDADVRAALRTLVRNLPLGLRRRVAFAAALGHDPELLVLDEPTSGVEPLARARLWETIRGAAEAGAGVLVTTHNMAEASECDRLVVLVGGRVMAAGTERQITGDLRAVRVEATTWEAAFAALDAARMPIALLGRSLRVPGAQIAQVDDLLRRAGVDARLELVPATFDEAFVALARPAA